MVTHIIVYKTFDFCKSSQVDLTFIAGTPTAIQDPTGYSIVLQISKRTLLKWKYIYYNWLAAPNKQQGGGDNQEIYRRCKRYKFQSTSRHIHEIFSFPKCGSSSTTKDLSWARQVGPAPAALCCFILHGIQKEKNSNYYKFRVEWKVC